jgi:hypothetical protein
MASFAAVMAGIWGVGYMQGKLVSKGPLWKKGNFLPQTSLFSPSLTSSPWGTVSMFFSTFILFVC